MFDHLRQNAGYTAIFAILTVVIGFARTGNAQENNPSNTEQDLGQKRNGFVLEPHFGIKKGIPVDEDLYLDNPSGGFLLGIKNNRVIYGIGLDLRRYFEKDEYDESLSYYDYYGAGEESTFTYTTFLICPGIRVAVLRSDDEKVELTLQADLGFGTRVFNDDGDGDNTNEDKYFNFTYSAGPGLRYWLHPQFALGATALVDGNVIRVEDDYLKEITHMMSISGMLQLTGVF